MTALGFKPSVAAEKSPGGFDSHPLPFFYAPADLWRIVTGVDDLHRLLAGLPIDREFVLTVLRQD